MKKEHLIIVLAVCTILGFIMEQAIKFFKPEVVKHIHKRINAFKEDSLLMKEIGGFDLWEYTYRSDKAECCDTVPFKITLFGKYKNAVDSGYAVKRENEDWLIVDEKIYTYE